ncbi:toxin glutamine deamidase domain-containing protein [Pseudomonas sp. PHC1]|uniref:toxin glutamine deamidase domain-containing protein n=1 Tax=Pseudomonas sp. PHC1 TaxID=3384759 RepID=UPI00396F2FDA
MYSNCVNCSIATDATLAGNPASALPILSTDGVSITVLETQYGARFLGVPSSESITQKMLDAGAGARGIVYGSYGPGQPGHVFNVMNQNGEVKFLDGQTGKVAKLDKFVSFKLLRTN